MLRLWLTTRARLGVRSAAARAPLPHLILSRSWALTARAPGSWRACPTGGGGPPGRGARAQGRPIPVQTARGRDLVRWQIAYEIMQGKPEGTVYGQIHHEVQERLEQLRALQERAGE